MPPKSTRLFPPKLGTQVTTSGRQKEPAEVSIYFDVLNKSIPGIQGLKFQETKPLIGSE